MENKKAINDAKFFGLVYLGLGIFLMVISSLAFSTGYYNNFVEERINNPNPYDSVPAGSSFIVMFISSFIFIGFGISELKGIKNKMVTNRIKRGY